MLTDIHATLSSAQAVSGSAASTDYYDFGVPYDMSRGEPLCILVTCDASADFTTGDETYTFSVQADDNSSFSSATTIAAIQRTGAQLTIGTKVPVSFHTNAERYIRLGYTVGGTSPSGTFTAELKPLCDVATETSNLPSGYTITI